MTNDLEKWHRAQCSYEAKIFNPDSMLATDLPHLVKIAEKIRSLIELDPGSTILDLASGNGMYAGKPQNETGYIYLDPEQYIVKSDHLAPQVVDGRFVRCDVHALPFAPSSFDAVTCVFSLDHFVKPGLVFKEAARILRPGGKFFVAQAVSHDDATPRHSDHRHHIYDFSQVSIANMYFNAGFGFGIRISTLDIGSNIFLFEGQKQNGV